MDIEKITLPNGATYNIKDSVTRERIATITSGIGGGMNYKGVTTTKLIDGSTKTTIVINNSNYTPVNGDIVAVNIEGSATLKTLKIEKDKIVLLPQNKNYSPIIITKNEEFYVLGNAIGVISKS